MKQALKEAIVLTASYYGRTLNEAVLNMYIEDLEGIPINQAIAAYRDWRRNPKNTSFPLPAQIRGMVCPELDAESASRELAARISGAITKFGWCNAKEAQIYIGPVGWGVVETYGGWSHLCQNLGLSIDPTVFQAQVREQLKVRLLHSHIKDQAFQLGEAVRAGDIEKINKLMRVLPSPAKSEEPA